MRKLILACCLLFAVYGYAQDVKLIQNLASPEERADYNFEQYNYAEAARIYRTIYQEDTTRHDLALKLGECYRILNDYQGAEKWFKIGIEDNQEHDPIYLLHYAQALTNNEKYDEAVEWYHKYAQINPEDSRALKKIATLNQLHFHFKDSQAVDLQPININSSFTDWAPAYFQDEIVFISGRGNSDKFKNVLNWQVESYNDLFITKENEDGSMKIPEKFHQELNSAFHEGPLIFYDNDSKIIFTQNESDGSDGDGGHLALYHAEFDKETLDFHSVKKLELTEGNYSAAHPALSPDFQTLYFASNMPGGYGSSDIYKASWDGTTWSNPQNMGPEINSEGNESFPFMMNEDELVFSSDGHGGLGGRDLFRVDFEHEHIELENLGFPFNSSKDDFGYISNELGSEGFLTSNRINGGSDDDIFKFRVIWAAVEFLVVDDEKGLPIREASIAVFKDEVKQDTRTTNRNGIVDFAAIPGEEYVFEVYKEGFEKHRYHLKTELSDAGTLKEIDVILDPEEVKKPPVKVDSTDFSSYSKFYNKERLILTVDDKIYEYRELGDYKFLVAGDEKILLDQSGVDESLSMKERALEAIADKGMEVGETFEISNVYFDVDETDFIEKYADQLRAAVDVLKASPRTKVEIKTFSDSRGTIKYNNVLTFKRAQKVARYFMENGVQGSRFFINNYGEQGILNGCTDDKECSEIQHAVNRRAEFKVIIE